ncbi:uncharacterized protein [Misgurnus anguillicaudatus]|uniref:uncharacterized protein n=1 Tax=Misgurnus anguillicaudatus TaxID=75329 RepID=UPI003CCF9D81
MPLRTLRSRLALFEEGGEPRVPHGSGPAAAEAGRKLRSWGSQLDLADELETGLPLSQPSPAGSSAPSLDSEARAAVSSAQGGSPDLHLSSSEEVDIMSVDVVDAEEPSHSSPAFDDLLEVVTNAVARLKLDWPAETQSARPQSMLDERFLKQKSQPSRRNMPFFPDLHSELSRSWKAPYSARVHTPHATMYSNIVGMGEHGYLTMPRVEQTLASYLSPAAASSLKSPSLPTKPVRLTSSLVGKAYKSAGQAGASLHTLAVLQAYQAELLKDLDTEAGGTSDVFKELRRVTDVSLRAIKETAKAVGRSMGALVATERHLWLNLSELKSSDRAFLLDAPVAPSGLFGDAVNTVVERFAEARKQSAAFERYLPRRAFDSRAAGREQPSYRASQKRSVATRGPPQKNWEVLRDVVSCFRGQPPIGESRQSPHNTVPVSPRCPRDVSVLTPPQCVFRGTAASYSCVPRARGTQHLSTRREALISPRLNPASLVQGTGKSLSSTQKASLERLVPLIENLAAWKLLPNVSQWVLQIIEKGYKIQFCNQPPQFNGVLSTIVGAGQTLTMEQEVETLLCKEAIECVPPHNRESGYYSRYFIVPKKDGGLRPILDLRHLNRSVAKLKFKMLTIKQIVTQIRSEDWFVTIDLKDAYFHISILPQHRRFLRFAFGGVAYQYRVLPFGLSLSPRTFTKCMDAALAPLRLRGIRVLNYIDDWLILAQSESMAAQHRDAVLTHMRELGLRLNAKKSMLSPVQRTAFLGVIWDSTTMQAHLSPARVESILLAVGRVKLGQSHTVKQFQRLLGLMAAASNVIPLGLLHMRPLQWWLKTKGFSPRGNPFRLIKVTRRCLRALDLWKRPWFLSQGLMLGAQYRRVTLTTDASLTGWGATMGSHLAHGLWGARQLSWHINCLEMMAVFYALRCFIPHLRGHHVLVRTDNTSVVAYINHQGGLRSRPLYKLARHILLWTQGKLLSLRAVYIPGCLNRGADVLSRQGLRPGEWRLHPQVVESIWTRFYQAEVDLFASRETTHCPLWFSLTHPAPLGLDAMVQPWPRLRLYAFPPIALLPGVLERVRRNNVRLLLVAPFWPNRIWFSDLVSLLDGSPWEIPVRRDLLSLAGGSILHPRPELWKLWVWPLRGPDS